MAKHPGFETFVRAVTAHHERLRVRLGDLIGALVGNKPEVKLEHCRRVIVAIQDLEMLLTVDLPEWVPVLENRIANYIGHLQSQQQPSAVDRPEMAQEIIQILINLSRDIAAPISFSEDGSQVVDFEDIFLKYQSASKLPELFDQLAALLQQVVDSGEIEKTKVQRALQGVISSLRRHRTGSYLSMLATWDTAKTLARNVLAEFADDNPIIGPIKRGINNTLDEIDVKWSDIHAEMKQAIATSSHVEITCLEYQTVKGLPAPVPKRLTGPQHAQAADDVDAASPSPPHYSHNHDGQQHGPHRDAAGEEARV